MRLALANRSRRAKEEIEFTNVGIINFAKIPPFLAFLEETCEKTSRAPEQVKSPQGGFLAALYYFYHFFTVLSSCFLARLEYFSLIFVPLRVLCAFGRAAQALHTSYARLRAFIRLDGFFCAPRRVGFVHPHRCAVLVWAAFA